MVHSVDPLGSFRYHFVIVGNRKRITVNSPRGSFLGKHTTRPVAPRQGGEQTAAVPLRRRDLRQQGVSGVALDQVSQVPAGQRQLGRDGQAPVRRRKVAGAPAESHTRASSAEQSGTVSAGPAATTTSPPASRSTTSRSTTSRTTTSGRGAHRSGVETRGEASLPESKQPSIAVARQRHVSVPAEAQPVRHSHRATETESTAVPVAKEPIETQVLDTSQLVEVVADGVANARSDRRREETPARAIEASVRTESGRRVSTKPGHTKPRRPLFKREYLNRGIVFSTIALAGMAIPIVGFGGLGAEAAQPLTASLVGGVSTKAETPTALTGSSMAAIKSATTDMKAVQAASSTSSTCTTDSAQGLRAAFTDSETAFVYPVAASDYHISSYFGYRSDPITGLTSFHAGDDFAAALNTPIHAIADGTVTYTGPGIDGRSSNLIIVEHNIGGHVYESWYIHMYDDGVLVSVGDKVTAGQEIGLVGSNGNSTGPHVHLEVHDPSLADESDESAELLDPLDFLSDHNAVDVTELCQ